MLKTPDYKNNDWLGAFLSELIDNATIDVAELRPRWERNLGLYRNRPISAPPDSSSPNYHVNIVQPKVDSKAAVAANAMFSQRLWVHPTKYSCTPKEADNISSTIQILLEAGGFKNVMFGVLPYVYVYGSYVVRVRYEGRRQPEPGSLEEEMNEVQGERELELLSMPDSAHVELEWLSPSSGLVVEPVHPADYVQYPVEASCAEDALIVGHRFWLRLSEIKETALKGVYDKEAVEKIKAAVAVSPSQIPGKDGAYSLTRDTMSPLTGDHELIELWDVVIKIDRDGDGYAERYRATVSKDAQCILMIEPYPYDLIWYHVLKAHWEPERTINADSTAQRLQSPQIICNQLVNQMLEAMAYAAQPPIIGNPDILQLKETYKPGQFIPTNGDPKITFIPTQFNGSYIPTMLEYIGRIADSAASVAPTAHSQQFRPNTTATEASLIGQSQDQAVSMDLTFLAQGVERIWKATQELVYRHFAPLKEEYMMQIPAHIPADMAHRIHWVMSAAASSSGPAQTLGKIQSFVNMVLTIMQVPQEAYQMYGIDSKELIASMAGSIDLPSMNAIMPSFSMSGEEGEMAPADGGNPMSLLMGGMGGMGGVPDMSGIMGAMMGGGQLPPEMEM